MGRIDTYADNETIEDNDKMLTYDTQEGTTKNTPFSKIWTWINSKFHALTLSSADPTVSTDKLIIDKNGTLTRLECSSLAKYSVGTYKGISISGSSVTVSSAIYDINAKCITDSAAAHNCMYRGRYLGTGISSTYYNAISTGKFTGLYLGDYWTINGVKYEIVDFDYYYDSGYTQSGKISMHHVVLMPTEPMSIPDGTALYGTGGALLSLINGNDVTNKETATRFKWNATAADPNTNTTVGGYINSRMRRHIMKAANTIVINSFGSNHIIPVQVLYPNPENTGLASSAIWCDQTDQTKVAAVSICDLPNETQIYGQQIFGQGSELGNAAYEMGTDKRQFSLFRVRSCFANGVTDKERCWLRSVASETAATVISENNGALYKVGSSNILGVRPRFLLG